MELFFFDGRGLAAAPVTYEPTSRVGTPRRLIESAAYMWSFVGRTWDADPSGKSTASDPQRTPQRDVPGILALGGGVPIVLDGEILGAVASSGSSQTTDDECAKAGVAKAESLLRVP